MLNYTVCACFNCIYSFIFLSVHVSEGLILFSQQMALVMSSDMKPQIMTQTHMALWGQPNLSLNLSFMDSSVIGLIIAVMQWGFKRWKKSATSRHICPVQRERIILYYMSDFSSLKGIFQLVVMHPDKYDKQDFLRGRQVNTDFIISCIYIFIFLPVSVNI